MSTAPVCPISRDQALPGMPGRMVPVAPRALDLPSLIAATNALRDLALSLFGPGAPANNFGPTGGKSTGSAKQDPGVMRAVRNNWRERRRDDEHKRIFHGNDKAIYIDVIRINNILFHYEQNDIFVPEDSFEWAYKPDVSLVNWAAVLGGVQT